MLGHPGRPPLLWAHTTTIVMVIPITTTLHPSSQSRHGCTHMWALTMWTGPGTCGICSHHITTGAACLFCINAVSLCFCCVLAHNIKKSHMCGDMVWIKNSRKFCAPRCCVVGRSDGGAGWWWCCADPVGHTHTHHRRHGTGV